MLTESEGRGVTAIIGNATVTISAPGATSNSAILASSTKYIKYSFLGSDLTSLAGNGNSVNLTIEVDGVQGFSSEQVVVSDVSVNAVSFGENTPIALRNGAAYRYGFQGQEKDDEVSGSGNSYTAMFWQYDSRLGRRWNLDPKPNPSISQYATFGNNPIFYTDPFGDTLKTNGSAASNNDVQSVGEKYSHFIDIDQNNSVSIDYESGKSDSRYYSRSGEFKESKYNRDVRNAKQHIGIIAIEDASVDTKNYLYSTGNSYTYTDRRTGRQRTNELGDFRMTEHGTLARQWFSTLSITASSSDRPGDAPMTGYDGQTTIMSGTITGGNTISPKQIARASYIFHEIREMYHRTHDAGMSYEEAHKKASDEEGYEYKNQIPGEFSKFSPE